MTINQENIDQLLFDYFEGNLSEQEKSSLLNFIHQNPEYEKDFSQWAKTYVCIDNTPKDYGLSATLLKKSPSTKPTRGWLYGGLALVILMGYLWFALTEFEKPIEKHAPTDVLILQKDKQNPISSPTIVEEEITSSLEPIPATSSKIHEPNHLQLNTITNTKTEKKIIDTEPIDLVEKQPKEVDERYLPENGKRSEIEKDLSESDAVTEKLPQVEVMAENDAIKVNPDFQSLPDSVETPEESEVLKRETKKLPIDLKPKEEFMPVNSNF